MTGRVRVAAVLAVAAGVLLSGCGQQSYDYEPVDLGAPGEVTAPGTTLAFGETAWLEHTFSTDSGDYTGLQGVTVRDIAAADASLFEEYSNAEEFAEYTPYLVVTQHQFAEDLPAEVDPDTVDLFPMLADGTDAEWLTSGYVTLAGPGDECGLSLPDYDEETRTLLQCFVALSSTDAEVTSAQYLAEDYTAMVGTDGNEYLQAPVTWE
ncbi:hypothetical protein [Ruania albidiflava]|uniref:hypothetical protein n=1 Tax=Ruania albidiflava TaxID=366586 RepID=UPI0003B7B523|nr:hypothetical protein [Ruania albidiflava]